jgi:predicted ATPase
MDCNALISVSFAVDSLMARLDRLGPAKEIIQIGAVIGGEFSYELLHAVHPIAEENLQSAQAKCD